MPTPKIKGEERKCRICKQPIELHWFEGVEYKLKKLQICFSCNFWLDRAENVTHRNSVVVNGNAYWIGGEEDEGFRGFAGQKFEILFNDGRKITTTNLWHNGKIPEHFRDILKDNAKFVFPKNQQSGKRNP